MLRLPALLLAGSVISAGVTLVGPGSTGNDHPQFEASLPPAEIKARAPQTAELAEPPLGPTQRTPEAASADNAVAPQLPDVRLTGIVIEPDRRTAIFAMSGTKPLMLSEGEALNGWRIDSISPQMVSLSSPAGSMTLKPKPDANLVRPSPPAAAPSGQPQPDVPPGFPYRGVQWPGVPPGPPLAPIIIGAGSLPAPPVHVPAYPYIDCNNSNYWQYCQEYYGGYDTYNEPYNFYDYAYPYYAYGVPLRARFGFGFFHRHGFHHAAVHRGFPAGFHAGGGRGGHR
jgi:hypothetical protein